MHKENPAFLLFRISALKPELNPGRALVTRTGGVPGVVPILQMEQELLFPEFPSGWSAAQVIPFVEML